MVVNSLIAGVTKYFSSLSVGSMFGKSKVSLIVADENKKQTKNIIEIDATSSTGATYSSTPINIPAESRKVYMDGTIVRPVTMNISGVIDKGKIASIQKLCGGDTWVYVLNSKEIGGAATTVGYYSNSKLYYISSLDIEDEGFSNCVSVKIVLNEVVLYSYELTYKYGIKQTNPISGNGKSTKTKTGEVTYPTFFGVKKEDGIRGILKIGGAAIKGLFR